MRLKDNRLRSRQLGLILEPDGNQLRLTDAETEARLLTRAEGRWQAEAEVERLRAELAKRHRADGRNGH